MDEEAELVILNIGGDAPLGREFQCSQSGAGGAVEGAARAERGEGAALAAAEGNLLI